MSNPLVLPTAEAFFFPGNKTGCVLIHGFTGTPKEMRWMGEYLNTEYGFTTLGVRLSGHATKISDMMRTRWWDWLASVEDGLNILGELVEKKVVIGLSMGGILTLLAAARYPVSAAVCMSAPSHLPNDWRVRLLRPISWVQREVDKGPPDWQSTDGAEGHVSYARYPTRSLVELRDLLRVTRAAAPEISAPVLFLQGVKDNGIPKESMETWYREVGSEVKQMVWLPSSGHVVTREPDRKMVYDLAAGFIKQSTRGS